MRYSSTVRARYVHDSNKVSMVPFYVLIQKGFIGAMKISMFINLDKKKIQLQLQFKKIMIKRFQDYKNQGFIDFISSRWKGAGVGKL